MKNEIRRELHKKPVALEESLQVLERRLAPVDREMVRQSRQSDEPILCIVGCARSGTTLVYQYLSYCGVFTYPTNFLSRFYYAPLLGAKIQEMLFDLDFRGEIFPANSQDTLFQSNLGKTTGPLAPHEFWYFWNRFVEFGEDQSVIVNNPDWQECFRELRSFQAVADKPLVLKTMNLNWHLPTLAMACPKIHFLFVERNQEANAKSLLGAREEFFGNGEHWYSFKPPGYAQVSGMSPIDQVRWQVEQTNRAITDGIGKIEPSRIFRVQLDEFCRNPGKLISEVCGRWEIQTPTLEHLPNQFGFSGGQQI